MNPHLNTRAAILERRERVAALVRRGWSDRRIAEETGLNSHTVQRHRRGMGLSQPRRPDLTVEEIGFARRLLEDGCSYHEAALSVGCADSTIRHHVPGFTKDRKESALLAALGKRWARLERDIDRGNWAKAGVA